MHMKREWLLTIWIVLAIVFIAYGLIVRAAGAGTGFFLVWIALGIVCLGLAAGAWFDMWRLLPVVFRRIVLVILALVLCSFLCIEGCVLSGFRKTDAPGLDAIIVLGAQVYEDGPSAALQYRLDRAYSYLMENPDTLCILSGGQGYNEPFPEAVGMAQYLEEKGIPEDRLVLETESENTVQNLANSKALIREDASIGIVTNDFHMFRALWIAKKQGLNQARGITAGSVPLYLPNNLLREYFAVIKNLVLPFFLSVL
jgi:uncharacterized SAM-binding protein YcdF (DUF218 family)